MTDIAVRAVGGISEVSEASHLDVARANVNLISSPEEAAHHLNRVEALRDAFKKLKNAEDQRIAAVRLEAAIYRRIGQLGGEHMFKGGVKRSFVRDLAAMDDETFERFLGHLDGKFAPVTAYREFKSQTPEAMAKAAKALEAWEAKREEFWRRMSSDEEFRLAYERKEQEEQVAIEEYRKSSSVSATAAELIDLLDRSDRPFTTRELATDVVKSIRRYGLEEELEWSDDPDFDQMIAETVRGAMRRSSTGHEYPFRRITFYADGEFMHVPWQVATVNQLEAYADYAQAQADDMQRKADRVRAVAVHYRRAVGSSGGACLVSEIEAPDESEFAEVAA